eukprot:TRINITY_DN7499_c0_g1_i1.p1 TRINITY_DN7499_c0_g1~~TRINITY_DN7499_c0_g1_i1.p1  ORF type:complete len:446 (+),score=105.75 TRINITY_DN7499_c0_g1_i1:266-1603(+)
MKSSKEDNSKKESSSSGFDWGLNQTLRNVQGLLKGKSFPGKVLLSRKTEEVTGSALSEHPVSVDSEEDLGTSQISEGPAKVDSHINNNMNHGNEEASVKKSEGNSPTEFQKSTSLDRSTDATRVAKFKKELSASNVELDILRELAWSGVPPYLRPLVWRLLLGYASPNSERREGALTRKRQEYIDCVSQYYDMPDSDRSEEEIHMLRQIAVDCPRTVPDVSFFQQSEIQKSLERILYTWAIRHPASGYVQGINDLVTPFLVVFLSEYLEGDMEKWSLSNLSPKQMLNVEADSYWCLSKLLDGIQDHYTFAQPGIQRLVFKLKELVQRIDEPVAKHMEEQGLEFLQFAFRWFNCLLIREIPFHLVTRLWDTYLAEGERFADFLVYVCASLFLTWSDQLQKLDFQEMVMLLQHLPTKSWSYQELEMVLSRAFMWHVMFDSAPSHLTS